MPLITRLHPDDILLGRGAPSAEYEGNARLRRIVLARRKNYMKTVKRKEKHKIAIEIVAETQINGGRFLNRIEDEEELEKRGVGSVQIKVAYEEVHDQNLILNKIKQLLRDIGPEARKKRAERRQERKRKRDEWSVAWVARADGGENKVAPAPVPRESPVARQQQPLMPPLPPLPPLVGVAQSDVLLAALRQEEATRQLLLPRMPMMSLQMPLLPTMPTMPVMSLQLLPSLPLLLQQAQLQQQQVGAHSTIHDNNDLGGGRCHT